MKPLIFHIDVNSAFLSWEAVYRLHTLGESIDLRTIPSAIGGDQEKRHGVILAKSTPAKKYKIQTGEPIVSALRKCPDLVIVPPRTGLYQESSQAFFQILNEYSPCVEKYSIDEAFMDMTGMTNLYKDPVALAHTIKDRIHSELGFTVNVGVSTNKLLAKMAGDFKKPNLVHTLFPEEIPTKMWPLDVRELFFVGKATESKLRSLSIHTIGDLAKADATILKAHFGKHGEVIYQYANGIDFSVVNCEKVENKGYSNATTLSHDVTNPAEAKHYLLKLCETVAGRLRGDNWLASVVAVSITDCNFHNKIHQKTLLSPTNTTNELYEHVCMLFDELWDKKTPIRLLGVHGNKLTREVNQQLNLFDMNKFENFSKLDQALDKIRNKYGADSIKRASFLDPK